MKLKIKFIKNTITGQQNYFIYEDDNCSYSGICNGEISYDVIMRDVVKQHFNKTIKDVKLLPSQNYDVTIYSVEVK